MDIESTVKGLMGIALGLGVLYGMFWLARRVLIFLRALLRPVLAVAAPVLRRADQAVADHVAPALERAGADKAAQLVRKGPQATRDLQNGLSGLLDAEEARIAARRAGADDRQR